MALLLCEPVDRKLDCIPEQQHRLAKSGLTVIPAKRSLAELKMDMTRVSRMVEEDARGCLGGAGGLP